MNLSRRSIGGTRASNCTLPSDLAAVVIAAVTSCNYAPTSKVMREALRDWTIKQAIRYQEIAMPIVPTPSNAITPFPTIGKDRSLPS